MRRSCLYGFIFALFFVQGVSTLKLLPADADDAAFTDYEKIVEAAFPVTKLAKRHSSPTPLEAAILKISRDGILRMVESAGAEWVDRFTAPARSTEEQRLRLTAFLKKTPVWVCRDGCSFCKGANQMGCTQTRTFGETLAAVTFVDECLFTGNCTPIGPKAKGAALQELFKILKNAPAEIAYSLLFLNKESSNQKDNRIEKAVESLNAAFSQVNQNYSACSSGRAMPESGMAYLKRAGHLKFISEVADRCGSQVIQKLNSMPLPTLCTPSVDSLKVTQYQKEWRHQPLLLTAVRADSFAEMMTCGRAESPEMRTLHFGVGYLISIPEGACEGETPVRAQQLVENQTRSWFNSRATASAKKECVNAIVKKMNFKSVENQESPASFVPTTSSNTSGIDVELIEQ